jgi:hypothetical protein
MAPLGNTIASLKEEIECLHEFIDRASERFDRARNCVDVQLNGRPFARAAALSRGGVSQVYTDGG